MDPTTDLPQLLVQTALALLFAAVLVGWFAKPATDPKEVVAWARAHDLQLTAGNVAMATYYVRLSITLRVIGGVGGLIVGAQFDDATGLDTSSGAGFWIWILLGWLLGASWAEYRLTRPGSGPTASLTPRRVLDYLPRRLYLAPAWAASLAVLIAVIGLLAPKGPSAAGLVLGAAGAILIAVLITMAIRAVVARRQPTGPPDIVAADDAIRASAVHNLAGGGTAAILLVSSQMAYSVLTPSDANLTSAGVWVAVLLAVAAFVAWRWSAYRHWRVRRGSVPAAVGS
jgi:hypothetical protein